VGATPAGEYQEAGVGPFQSIEVALELKLRCRMTQAFLVPGDIPTVKFRIKILPEESTFAVRGIPEIIYFVSAFPKPVHNFRVKLVSPAACYIYLCHIFLKILLRI
jgi:hypothetical protein